MINFRLYQTEEFADDNFNFGENGRKFSTRVENTVGKREKLQAISPFHTVFSKDLYLRHKKNQGLFGKGLFSSLKYLQTTPSKLVQFSDKAETTWDRLSRALEIVTSRP